MKTKPQPTLFAEPQLAMFDKSPEQIALELKTARGCACCGAPSCSRCKIYPGREKKYYCASCGLEFDHHFDRGAEDFNAYTNAGGAAYSCQQAWDEVI